jgi:hypothetical protein
MYEMHRRQAPRDCTVLDTSMRSNNSSHRITSRAQIVDDSSRRLRQTRDTHRGYSSYVESGAETLHSLRREERRANFAIAICFAVFFLVAAYVTQRRIANSNTATYIVKPALRVITLPARVLRSIAYAAFSSSPRLHSGYRLPVATPAPKLASTGPPSERRKRSTIKTRITLDTVNIDTEVPAAAQPLKLEAVHKGASILGDFPSEKAVVGEPGEAACGTDPIKGIENDVKIMIQKDGVDPACADSDETVVADLDRDADGLDRDADGLAEAEPFLTANLFADSGHEGAERHDGGADKSVKREL